MLGPLTHPFLDKMVAISQKTSSNAFSLMKMLEFQFKFHWNLLLRVQLTISQHWFRWYCWSRLVPIWWQAITWTIDDQVHWCIYVALGGDELIPTYNGPINTLRPRQNGRHFADDTLKCIFLNENVWIPIEISLKFVPKGPIDNIPALV